MRIATYNIGDYTGRGFERGSVEGIEAFREAISKTKADFWGLQEDVCCYGDKEGLYPYNIIYNDYKKYERCGSHRYNYKAFLTNQPLANVRRVFYYGDRIFNHPWFLAGEAILDGKSVTVVTLHFDWQDNDTRTEQIKQVIDFILKSEYAIVLGDFNPCDYKGGVKISDEGTHIEDCRHFTDAGLNIANCGKFGTFHTFIDTPRYPAPIDNIVTTPNISIDNVGTVQEPWMYDHAILWADISFK